MKVYVLVLYLDYPSTRGGVQEFIEVSTDKEKLKKTMNKENRLINKFDWSDDKMEYIGVTMSSKPRYYIIEKEIN
jgi:hypothetical protein